jgi:hypothetical protein
MYSAIFLTFRCGNRLLREGDMRAVRKPPGCEEAHYERSATQILQSQMNEGWCGEEIDNASQESRIQRRRLGGLERKESWLTQLRPGELDKIGWDVTLGERRWKSRLARH